MNLQTKTAIDLPRVYLPHNLIGESSYYMNCGYWTTNSSTYDQACQNLIELLIDAAKIGPKDTVLDLGCGYGDQDLYLAQNRRPQRIHAVNISSYQVTTAQRRLLDKPEAQRIEFSVGDAVHTGLENESFDVVMAVECSAHFRTRAIFLREAWRLLRPGGRLVLCDVLAPDRSLSAGGRFLLRSLCRFWRAPWENIYDIHTYRRQIQAANFDLQVSTSIREQVFAPLLRHCLRLVREHRLPPRMDLDLRLAYHTLLRLHAIKQRELPLDYAYVVATKRV